MTVASCVPSCRDPFCDGCTEDDDNHDAEEMRGLSDLLEQLQWKLRCEWLAVNLFRASMLCRAFNDGGPEALTTRY